MENTLIIIPTYNEKENIDLIIKDILSLEVDILVVDDNSPDGTAKSVKELKEYNKRVSLLHREEKSGLGSAYRDGFKWAIKHNYEYVGEMDADFSHSVVDLNKLLKIKKDYGLVVGSRYVKHGKIVGWNKKRYLLSYIANKYSKLLTFSSVNDMTSGFRIYSIETLKKINFHKTKSNGYSFQIEMTVLCLNQNITITEIPITFHERREGLSKMNKGIVFEALFRVFLFTVKRIKYFLTTT